MSQYLIQRIEAQPNIDVVVGCEISELEGAAGELEAVVWRDRQSGSEEKRAIRYLFSFIGAEPNTDWLAASGIRLDDRGFVAAANDAFPLETSRSGVFAVGDVRSGSVKRVAASVGDGAAVVAAIHAYLATRPEQPLASLAVEQVVATA
jgi:thioredoxin reductase (NADPH)